MQSVLSDIKNTTQKLRDNAQNILSWIKHQNKRIIITKGNIAVAAFVEEISEQFIEMAASKNTKISVSISEEDIIKSDATILSIVLHNLISNACKFTENGSVEIIGNFTPIGYFFTVKDNGIELLEFIKGKLSIESEVGLGTSVTIQLMILD